MMMRCSHRPWRRRTCSEIQIKFCGARTRKRPRKETPYPLPLTAASLDESTEAQQYGCATDASSSAQP